MKTRYNDNIKIFSNNIPKGFRMRDFNKFVRVGKAKLQRFPGATSNQLLHYLDVNIQDNNTESIILHVGVTVQKQILIVFSITSKKWLRNVEAIM